MKKDSIQSFKQVFGDFLKKENLDQKFNEKKLISMWHEMMGATIANRTTGIFIKNKMMFVKLTSAPLKQELTMSKAKVLELIARKIGTGVIEDVRFL
jgi:predicted nucleic acid-binding Zn ribbon protein